MPEPSRKRHREERQDKPRKKIAQDTQAKTIKVSVIQDDHHWDPVLASSPGITLSKDLALKPYTKARSHPRSPISGPELLLHSSTHPKLDHVAREESSQNSENHISHYIGVYDDNTGELQLVQARKAVIRSVLRSARDNESQEDSGRAKQEPANNLSARSNLGLAFGTKKSQKAIRALTANAIQSSPSKSKTQGSPEGRPQLDPLASAVVSSMADSTSSMRTREEMQAEIDEGKPRPKPNLQASTPAEVYPLEQLVGGPNTLPAMGVKEWVDKVKSGTDVQLKSRCIARKLAMTVQSGDVKKLKTMRYLLLLIEWFMALKPGAKSTKKVPKDEDMGPLITAYGSEVVAGVTRRFADRFQLNRWHIDNIITHILALTITLDNFTTDTHDIREDLRLESKDVCKYYGELGCVIALPTDTERSALGISKAEGQSHRIARLRTPLAFPKARIPMSGKKRR